MKWLTLLLVTIIPNFIFSQTTIPAGNVSGTWDLTGSPYLIEGEIEIPNGETLIIDPGCLIEFQGHYKFNVLGCLLAIGTEQDSIKFTISDTTGFHINNIPDGGWDGIHFEPVSAINDTSKIKYSILEYGKAIDTNSSSGKNGGAIYIKNDHFLAKSNILISNSLIRNNYALYSGGGIYVSGFHNWGNSSDIIIINSIIENNVSGIFGGGIAFRHADFVNNVVRLNRSKYGGGIDFYNLTGLCIGNLITNNSAIKYGGGVQTYGGSIVNCSIIENNAEFGAGICCEGTDMDDASAINCIIYGNEAVDTSQVYMKAILWWMQDPQTGSIIEVFISANLDIYYSIIENGYNGIKLNLDGGLIEPSDYDFDYENNIDSDPLFLDPENNNFHFLTDSPCFNSGKPDTTGLNLPENDLDGNQRIFDNIIDIGCYEFQPICCSEDELDFGLVLIDTMSDSLEFHLSNSFFEDICVTNISITDQFYIKTQPNGSYYNSLNNIILPALSEYTIYCACNLNETGNYFGEMVLTFENSLLNNETIHLSAEGYSNTIIKYDLHLYQNYPNPFNPTTEIRFQLKDIDDIETAKIEIYNIKGQKVKTLSPSLCHPELVEGRGEMSIIWNGTDSNNKPVSSGIYFYQLKIDDKVQKSKKMMLIK